MGFQFLAALLLLAFLAPFVLAGECSKVPVISVIKLARIDFETTNTNHQGF